jgi:hypothetical protein
MRRPPMERVEPRDASEAGIVTSQAGKVSNNEEEWYQQPMRTYTLRMCCHGIMPCFPKLGIPSSPVHGNYARDLVSKRDCKNLRMRA